MPLYLPSDIASILGINITINNEESVECLLTDSRRVVYAKNSIFFAIKGNHHDGHLHIMELFNYGIRNFVVENIPERDIIHKANFYLVNNTIEALHKICIYHRNIYNIPIIGITGSNGKTIVKEWLFQVLREIKNIVRNPRSYNSQIGVPLSVWNIEQDNNLGIFEAGISFPGEMNRLEKLIDPTIGVFTNIGDAHQENFTTEEEKIYEKSLLFKNAEVIIYNSDYDKIDKILKESSFLRKVKLFSWSVNKKASFTVKKINKKAKVTEIEGVFNNKTRSFSIPFTDEGSIQNAINVYCVLLFLNIDISEINEKMMSLAPVEMRLEQKKGNQNCTIINDSYNSDLNSISIAIDYLNQQHQHNKKTVILSDILESGKNDQSLYKHVSELIKIKGIDQFIGIGSRISDYKHYFDVSSKFYETTNEFIDHFNHSGFNNQSVLLKGARSFKFELIEELLELKVHRTRLLVNLDAVIHNLNFFRSLIKPETKVMAMVKAISYGSGTYEIAHLLKFHRIDYLGVAYTDEGILLRKAGVNTPIMVMNPEYNQLKKLIEYSLEPEIYCRELLLKFKECLENYGEQNYPCHIKLDTGMHRLGFIEEDIDFIINECSKDNLIKIQSIFSHLAASDDPDYDDLTKKQVLNFDICSERIMIHFNYPVIRHILNSSGIVRFSKSQYNMVRLGIGLYGFAANAEGLLQNVFTLKTLVSQIKIVNKGETVGYNPKHTLIKDTKIGIIAIGYADGFIRKIGNGNGKVLINNKFAPIIGNICMDMCMIDISDHDGVKEGDEVVVFGDDYTAAEVAKQLETIPYEVITNISERINRVYYKE